MLESKVKEQNLLELFVTEVGLTPNFRSEVRVEQNLTKECAPD